MEEVTKFQAPFTQDAFYRAPPRSSTCAPGHVVRGSGSMLPPSPSPQRGSSVTTLLGALAHGRRCRQVCPRGAVQLRFPSLVEGEALLAAYALGRSKPSGGPRPDFSVKHPGANPVVLAGAGIPRTSSPPSGSRGTVVAPGTVPYPTQSLCTDARLAAGLLTSLQN
jgi:hypothetical protein